jgi:hypothetical protein
LAKSPKNREYFGKKWKEHIIQGKRRSQGIIVQGQIFRTNLHSLCLVHSSSSEMSFRNQVKISAHWAALAQTEQKKLMGWGDQKKN